MLALSAAPAAAVTVTVPDDWPTIQQAIDSGANEILIRPGTYNETPVIATIPGNPNGWPEIDDLVIRGLVPAGTSLDSIPVVAGLVLETLAGFWTHSPSITLTDLSFSKVVENRFQDNPYSNPLTIGIRRCVFGGGLSDNSANVGGQLEYYVSACRIEGPLQLAFPQVFFLETSLVLGPVVLGRWYSYPDMIHISGNRFEGSGRTAIDVTGKMVTIQYNSFASFEVPIRGGDSSEIGVTANTFVGPGTTPLEVSPDAVDAGFLRNHITGFDVGVLSLAKDSRFHAVENLIENCGTAIRADVSSAYCVGNVIRSCSKGVILDVSEGLWTARRNVVEGCDGDGLVLRAGWATVDSNVVGYCGGDGIRLTSPNEGDNACRLTANTAYRNGGSGFVLSVTGADRQGTADHNIAFENGRYALETPGTGSVQLGCNDWYGNVAGSISGAEAGATDLALDPFFCDVAVDDVHLSAGSPLLNAAGCGTIGAPGQGCEAPVVCRLATFAAASTIEGIEVRWQVADAAPGFVAWLERAEAADGPWARVESERSSDGDVTVEYDRTAAPARSYWYRLVATDRGLTRALGEPIRVETAPPTRFALLGTGPNPSPGAVEATFELAHAAEITLELFDAQGRRVATLARGSWPAGIHRVSWVGARPASGVYLVRYRHPGGEDLRRMAVVR